MVKSESRIVFVAVAVIMMGIASTQAEAPLSGYERRSDISSRGYSSSSQGYVYGPPKEAGIPGTPGVDYPAFTEVPPTSFSCERQPLPGYYADQEAGCQVYHVCQKGVKEREAMLCPVGSIFDQEKLTCAWWYTVDCARSAAAAPAVNADVVAAMERADALAKANRYAGYGHGGPSGAYGAPSQAYGVPSGAFGSPSAAYGAPANTRAFGSYNSRAGPFNALLRSYGAPSRRFGGSFGGFGGSSRAFGSPSRAYGAPSTGAFGFGGGAPSGTYGAPSIGSSGAPSEEYGVPGNQGGRSYLPPSF